MVLAIAKLPRISWLAPALALLLTIFGGGIAKGDPPELPEAWREFILADQRYNTGGRAILETYERRVQPVYHWDIPEEKVNSFSSKFIDPETAKFVKIEKNGKRFIRFYMVDESFTEFENMKRNFGKPEQIFWGTRMQSKGTYFVWDPRKQENYPFFVKMQRRNPIPHRPAVYVNAVDSAEVAVRHSDLMEQQLRDGPYDSTKGSFFPERFGAAVNGKNNFTYAFSVRSARPFHKDGVRGQLWPVHGVLSSPHLKTFAKLARLTEEEWIQREYIPALARFHAQMNLRGFFLEGHTQNLVADIDPKTGKVLGFNIRDMTDLIVDPVSVRLGNGPIRIRPANLPASLLNERWIDANSKEAHSPGNFFWEYSDQALRYPDIDVDSDRTVTFFRHYIKSTEEILGHPIPLSPAVETLFQAIEKQHIDSKILKDLFPVEHVLHSRLDLAKIKLVEEIHASIIAARFANLRSTLKAVPSMQSRLRETYNFVLTRRNNPFAAITRTSTPSALIDYAWDGEGIWAINRETGELLGYAYALSDRDSIRLTRLARRTQILCSLFAKFRGRFSPRQRAGALP